MCSGARSGRMVTRSASKGEWKCWLLQILDENYD